MSEGQLSRLLRRVKLLARRDVILDQTGHMIGGALDPFWQLLEIQLDTIHDQFLDGYAPISVNQFLAYCEQLVNADWHLVRDLERQYA